jgi:predicted nucleic acid-binding protein
MSPEFLPRRSDDDMVLETAVNAQAEAIVTYNRRDFWPRIEPFGVAVWSPGEAIGQLEARR